MDRKATDKRLQRVYGITLDIYEQMLAYNDGKCWVCNWKPGPEHRALAVDHDHAMAKLRYLSVKVGTPKATPWLTYVPEFEDLYCGGKTKRESVAKVKMLLKKFSVRGLLCWKCNTLLKKGRDNPDILESAARYLRKYKEKFGVNKEKI